MVQEVTSTSWVSRIINSFAGIIIGILLIILSIILIFWNEHNALNTSLSLEQAQQVLVQAQPAPINQKNNLMVIYFSGMATTQDKLTDTLLGITVEAIKLDRKVEMYQWQEHVESKTDSEMGGSETETKTYTYSQIWSEKLINSTQFKDQTGHANPSAMPVSSKHLMAKNVYVGDFRLPDKLIEKINNPEQIKLTDDDIYAVQTKIQKKMTIENDSIYVGEDPQSPKIGDLRISASKVMPQNVSIIAQQIGDSLQAFMAPAGRPVMLLSMGTQSSDNMITEAQSENRTMTWIWRVVSFVMIWMGFALIMKPLVVIADVLPILGSIIGAGTGLVAFVFSVLLWSCVTALAWFAVRPLWALILIAIAVTIAYVLINRKKQTL